MLKSNRLYSRKIWFYKSLARRYLLKSSGKIQSVKIQAKTPRALIPGGWVRALCIF